MLSKSTNLQYGILLSLPQEYTEFMFTIESSLIYFLLNIVMNPEYKKAVIKKITTAFCIR